MYNFKKLALGAVILSGVALGAQNAHAQSELRLNQYSDSGFASITTEQKDAIVVVTKDGCPVCTRQINALENILENPEFSNLEVQQISVSNPAAKEKFNATRQSLIIIYDDGQEVSRLQSVTDEAEIKNALKSIL